MTTLEERADDVLEWLFALPHEEWDHLNETALLANVARHYLKWKRLQKNYDGTWIALAGVSAEEEAFSDLTECEQRGVMSAYNLISRIPTGEPPIDWAGGLPKWLDKLDHFRLEAV